MAFGTLLRRERTSRSLSLAAVASELGVSWRYVADVELERRSPLVEPSILRAAAFMGCDPLGLLAAAAADRGTLRIDVETSSARQLRVGAALLRSWSQLTDAQVEAVAAAIGGVGTDTESIPARAA